MKKKICDVKTIKTMKTKKNADKTREAPYFERIMSYVVMSYMDL